MGAPQEKVDSWTPPYVERLLANQAAIVETLWRDAQARRFFEAEVRERLDRIELRQPPALLTRKQAAKLLKVSVRAIDWALDKGTLREVRLEGSRGRLVDATSIKSVNVAEEVDRIKKEIYAAR